MSPIVNSAVTRITPSLWSTDGESRGFMYRYDRGWGFKAGGIGANIPQHPEGAEGAGFVASETGGKVFLNWTPVVGQTPNFPWVGLRWRGPGIDISYRLNMYETDTPFGEAIQDWVDHFNLLDELIAGHSLGDIGDQPPDPNNGNIPIPETAFAVWVFGIAPQGEDFEGNYPSDLGPFQSPMFDPLDGRYRIEIPGRPNAPAQPPVVPAIAAGQVTMGTLRLRTQEENAI